MGLRGPSTLLFDVTLTGSLKRIAYRDNSADVAVPTAQSGGFIQIPFAMGGFGFTGVISAKTGNATDVTITCAAPDTPTTDTATPNASNSSVANQNPSNLGTMVLKAGEVLVIDTPIDLYLLQASGNASVLHFAGSH